MTEHSSSSSFRKPDYGTGPVYLRNLVYFNLLVSFLEVSTAFRSLSKDERWSEILSKSYKQTSPP